MILFWLGVTIILMIVLVIIWWPFFGRPLVLDSSRQQTNIAIYQRQLTYFNKQFSIQQPPLQQITDELALNLLQDTQDPPTTIHQQQPRKIWPIAITLLAIGLPVISYIQLDRYQPAAKYTAIQQQDPFAGLASQDINDLQVAELQQTIRRDPANSQAWFSLGQYYLLSDRFDNALFAFNKAIQIEGESPDLLAAKATSLYYLNQQKITPEIQQLIDQILLTEPLQITALMLLASDHFYHARYQQAIDIWQRLLDSDNRQIDRAMLIERIMMARTIK